MPESKDSEYPEAIRVLIDGKVVGSLSRYDAPLYRPGLSRLMGRQRSEFWGLSTTTRQTSTSLRRRLINSRLKVGWFRTSEPGSPRRVQPTLRTTGYDFSWYKELLGDESTAVKKLRTMLETERDPIDRHYMMCELEQRLYRGRGAFASALDEYDGVCHRHDEEMRHDPACAS